MAREKAAADGASRKLAAVESELAEVKRQLAMAQAVRDQLQASVGEGARKQSELAREVERERERVVREMEGERKRREEEYGKEAERKVSGAQITFFRSRC